MQGNNLAIDKVNDIVYSVLFLIPPPPPHGLW